MTTRRLHAAALLAALLLAPGCGDDKPAAKDPDSRTADDVFGELTASGLVIDGVAATDGAALAATDCTRASASKLEVTVCRYPDEAAARAAQPAGLVAVGEATGAALHHGRLLLVVADRGKVDPAGKLINQITKAFLQKPAGPAGSAAASPK